MTARIAFAGAVPYCHDNREKVQLLEELEEKYLDNIFCYFGGDACDAAEKLIKAHPFYRSWDELEKNSSDITSGNIYIPRAVYSAVRAELIALDRAGLADVYASQCGEGVYIEVSACGQVTRRINRIINRAFQEV